MSRDTYDVIVVGGGYAGVTAANRLPRSARVALVDPKPDFIHRVRLHEYAAGGNPRVQIPFRRILRRGVEHLRSLASVVEPGVVYLTGGGTLRGRHILLATGSDAGIPNGITSIETAAAVRAHLDTLPAGSHVELLGAGVTGIELAAELAYRRRDLTIRLGGHSAAGDGLPERAREYLRDELESIGVVLDHPASEHAFVIDTTGLSYSALAQNSGLDLESNFVSSARPGFTPGRLIVSPTLESLPGIWGAGDTVSVTGQNHLRPSCAAAIPMGAHAADNIARALKGLPPRPFTFGYTIRCLSLGRRSGLIIAVDAHDRPTGRYLGGLGAASIKSFVCAGVVVAPSPLARHAPLTAKANNVQLSSAN